MQNTIKKIESSIKRSSIADKKKKELVRLLAELKTEIEKLSKTHGEHAQSIAGFTQVASHEATRKEKSTDLIQLSLDGLASSVEGFETSHPRLAKTVGDLCNLLSGIGI